MNNETEQIGFLTSENEHYAVVCSDCADKRKTQCAIFKVNIFPYKQTCIECKRVLVEGQTDYWPELFTGDR